MRTKFNKLPRIEQEIRDKKILQRFRVLRSKGMGKMAVYQQLGDEFGIIERNHVGKIVRDLQNLKKNKQNA